MIQKMSYVVKAVNLPSCALLLVSIFFSEMHQSISSSLLTPEFSKKLLEWLPPGKNNVSLLYQGSRDGFEASDFHRCCDNKGPYLVVVKATHSNCIFGGYSAVSLLSYQRWIQVIHFDWEIKMWKVYNILLVFIKIDFFYFNFCVWD